MILFIVSVPLWVLILMWLVSVLDEARQIKRDRRREAAVKARRAEEAAEHERERAAQELEQRVRRMAEGSISLDRFMAQCEAVGPMPDMEACERDPEAGARWLAAVEAYEAKHGRAYRDA